jgi:DNA-directed RNA polymerase specialized sigma24 family protein
MQEAFNHVAKYSRKPKHQELDDVHVCQTDGPEQTIQKSNILADLMVAIRQWPITQRQLITLALDGTSYADIAIITGLSLSNVGTID